LSGSQGSLSPFSSANRQIQQQQPPFIGGMSPTTSAGYQQQQQQQRRPVTLEDIEADMQRQQAANRYRASQNNSGSPMMTNGKTISLAELEATLAANRPQQQQQPQQPQAEHGIPPFGFAQPDPMQILAMKQQQELKEQQLSMARELKRRELYRKVWLTLLE
jgi:DNA topoisomerase 2-associated protein PAT1